MPTRSPPAALPLLSWQRPSLCICKEWIDGGVFLVVSIHGVEFFTNTRKSLAVDICSHGIRIKLATRPAPCLRESVSLFEQGVRNRNCGFHELSITVVIPCFKRNNPASPSLRKKPFFCPGKCRNDPNGGVLSAGRNDSDRPQAAVRERPLAGSSSYRPARVAIAKPLSPAMEYTRHTRCPSRKTAGSRNCRTRCGASLGSDASSG
jgi:hypothetical protein